MEAKSSNGGEEEVPIFTDTNMGTHIALSVSPHITTFDFQKEVERIHLSCFPKLGGVEATKVMVKRKACFYCLPKSLQIKYAFRGLDEPWSVHVEMRPMSCLEKKHSARDSDFHMSDYRNVAESITGNTEMNDMVLSYQKQCLNTILVKPEEVVNTSPFWKKNNCVDKCLGRRAGGDSDENCQNASDRISGLAPLGSTIERDENILGFPQSSDIYGSVASSTGTKSLLETHLEGKSDRNFSKRQNCGAHHFAVGTPTRNLHCIRNKFGARSKVGKRIISAAYKLKVSRNKQRPSASLFRSASPGNASAMFEMSESDD